MKKGCAVLVVYDNDKARDKALAFCDAFVGRCGGQMEMKVTVCSANDLSQPSVRKKATGTVRDADMLVFALDERQMPTHLHAWAEEAAKMRNEKEGFLAFISDCRHGRSELLLRAIAHKAGLDFITEPPLNPASALPESPETYSDRAHEMSSFMANILRRPPPPAPRIPAV